jgi:hypothetical protein
MVSFRAPVTAGHAQPLGQHVRHHLHAAVGGLGTAEHQVGVLPLDGLGQDLAGGDGARAAQRVVDDVDGGVRAHRQRLADGLGGPVRTHGQDDDLAALSLLDAQRLLDGVLVHLVDDVIGARPFDRVVVGTQAALSTRIRHLLHKYDDLHACAKPPTCLVT